MGTKIRAAKEEVEKSYKHSRELSPAKLEATGPETKNGIIINSLYVNIRKEASYESEVLEVLRKGDNVIILDRVGEFYKISTNTNQIAYVSSNFIKEE